MVDLNQAQPQPIWTIKSVVDTGINDPTRGYVPGYRVTIALMNGTTFTLDFAKAAFSADAVRTAVEKEVATLLEVQNLQGQPLQY